MEDHQWNHLPTYEFTDAWWVFEAGAQGDVISVTRRVLKA